MGHHQAVQFPCGNLRQKRFSSFRMFRAHKKIEETCASSIQVYPILSGAALRPAYFIIQAIIQG
jgi:hypothetical protein